MILTYKLKHEWDFSEEFIRAKKVAEYAVMNKRNFKVLTSKYVKHYGLKSVISNQILRKYGRNKKIKSVKNVNLIIPNQGIKEDKENRIIKISSLKLELKYQFPNNFEKINQIEINKEYAFISVTIPENQEYRSESYVGVDLNATGHVAVVANPETGKVLKLGKKAQHTHKKYSNIRKTMQKQGKFKKLKQIKKRESRIISDLNHKISKGIIEFAYKTRSGIRLEDLKGIRKTAKSSKSFRYSLNSWSFYQLKIMIEYKAKLLGVPVSYVDPRNTSKTCSNCGLIGKRDKKSFKCPACGHVDHSDVNAAFNIGMDINGVYQSGTERDVLEGSTDTPKMVLN